MSRVRHNAATIVVGAVALASITLVLFGVSFGVANIIEKASEITGDNDMRAFPGVPAGTKVDRLTYDEDARVAGLVHVTIEKPGRGKPGRIWAADSPIPPEVAEEAALAAAILRDYLAGEAQPPSDADRLERSAREIVKANADASPAALRRAAELVEQEVP